MLWVLKQTFDAAVACDAVLHVECVRMFDCVLCFCQQAARMVAMKRVFQMSHCMLWLAKVAEMSGAVCFVVMKPCHIGMCAGTCITAAKPYGFCTEVKASLLGSPLLHLSHNHVDFRHAPVHLLKSLSSTVESASEST